MKKISKTPTIFFDSFEAALLYEEFLQIPNNPFGFSIPPDFIVSSHFMITMIKTAYAVKGWDYIDDC
ncbi:hypothetical protein C3B58_12750 [Lactonifactor longoviformis]|uniref:Uncharacterized protein n=1 Tax=Lactonifactor longoviformis DSM 17459 TaxID=1122155 RepID=A0A1M5D7I8_9CLOT|nr:hypothetical protein [Lactonifactor longoviformis]POP32266.1 hypothetical protein C3B58_12750 [Lactonifactor longoviformis]SHF62632.1 hypothetical protein SAMN02745158_04433 [Lactonifactor longoviformis DSM 17459]